MLFDPRTNKKALLPLRILRDQRHEVRRSREKVQRNVDRKNTRWPKKQFQDQEVFMFHMQIPVVEEVDNHF